MIVFIIVELILIVELFSLRKFALSNNVKLLDLRNDNDIKWYINATDLEKMRIYVNRKSSKF